MKRYLEDLQVKMEDLGVFEKEEVDELLMLENLRLAQMLVIAAKDICRIDGSDVNDYLHDLSTRDYFEEMKGEQ